MCIYSIVDSRHQDILTINILVWISLEIESIVSCSRHQDWTEVGITFFNFVALAIQTVVIRIVTSTCTRGIFAVGRSSRVCLQLECAIIVQVNFPVSLLYTLRSIINISITTFAIGRIEENLVLEIRVLDGIVIEQGENTRLSFYWNNRDTHGTGVRTKAGLSIPSIAIDKPHVCLDVLDGHSIGTIQLQVYRTR